MDFWRKLRHYERKLGTKKSTVKIFDFLIFLNACSLQYKHVCICMTVSSSYCPSFYPKSCFRNYLSLLLLLYQIINQILELPLPYLS